MQRPHLIFAAVLGSAAALGVASCSSGDAPSPPAPQVVTPPPGETPHVPFAPVAPSSYVAKVKDLLVGLPPTDAEIAAVTKDPSALKGLIDQWTQEDAYKQKMLAFFKNAFQQTQITAADLVDQVPAMGQMANGPVVLRLLNNVRDSFALTVWDLVTKGQPLHQAMTTRTFMVTPPLLALYAYVDDIHVDDAGARIDRIVQANKNFQFVVEASAGPIPIAQTLDPNNANYMHWYSASMGQSTLPAGCQDDPRTYLKNSSQLYQLIMGTIPQVGQTCNATFSASQFDDAEFDAWRPVTFRQPNGAEATTAFYDLPTLRTASEVVLKVPRVGFFSTPAFFANWQTNSSNQSRVTMNQTLIVALGKAFDDTNSITPVSETGLDGQHAGPNTPCYGCHKTLDPMRQFFRKDYTLSYHDQTDAQTDGVFAFGGVSVQGHGIGDLATQLAQHPRFATAWALKLCYYANSAACSEDDPEFQRVVTAFQSSGYKWNVLVRELLASPLTTGASDTKTFDDAGEVVAIARRDHLCVALSNRLGIPDLCGVGGELTLTAPQKAALQIATVLPADGYSRGAEAPVLANDPTLFFRAGTENLCRIVADQIIDVKTGSKYSSGKADDALADFVHTVMALPASNPHAAGAQQILSDHFAAAKAQGASPTDALKSAFVLACLSPTTVGRGL